MAMYLVPSGMGQSMIAHSAADPAKVEKARRETVRRGLMLVAPVALVLAVGAPLVLALFGPHYADAGTGALALVALSAVPNVITAAATSTARVRQRRGVQFGVPTSLSVLAIGLSWLLMPQLGILAVGLAWLVAQCVVAAVVLVANAPWLPGPLGSWIDGIRGSALLRRVGEEGLRRTGGPDGWALGARMGGGSDSVVVTVGPVGERRALLKAADTANGQRELRQQTSALAALHADPRLQHWTPLIPRVLGTAEVGDTYLLTETLLPGGSGPDALADARLRGQVVGVGWVHGDYLPVNLLAAPNGQVSAIIDWCTARPDSLSVLDIATFVPMAE